MEGERHIVVANNGDATMEFTIFTSSLTYSISLSELILDSRITSRARVSTVFTFLTPLDDTNKSDSARLLAQLLSVLSAAL